MIKCRICGKRLTYRDTEHLRAHEKTDYDHFRTEPFEYADVCRECYEKIFERNDCRTIR